MTASGRLCVRPAGQAAATQMRGRMLRSGSPSAERCAACTPPLLRDMQQAAGRAGRPSELKLARTASQMPWLHQQSAATGRGRQRTPAARSGAVLREAQGRAAAWRWRGGQVRRHNLPPTHPASKACSVARQGGTPAAVLPAAAGGRPRARSRPPPGPPEPLREACCTKPPAGAPLQPEEEGGVGQHQRRFLQRCMEGLPLVCVMQRHATHAPRCRPAQHPPMQGCSSWHSGAHCCAALRAVANSHSGRSGRSVGRPPENRGGGKEASCSVDWGAPVQAAELT